jgi:REP element-mobilizing transposase RayT
LIFVDFAQSVWFILRMARRLRLEYEGAIYYVTARGNARQKIVHDDDDRQRLLDDLERTVVRAGWELVAFVVLSNHLHLLVKTPRSNLARGMQGFLSSFAQWTARRRNRPGHLFQGRYQTGLIEDETYYWTVSRYMHLNPVRARFVAHPKLWAWSSYPGYADQRRRLDWVAYDSLLHASRGESGGGGGDPAAAYRRYVEAGLANPPRSPFRDALGGWILGSDRFIDRLRQLVGTAPGDRSTAEVRQLLGRDPHAVIAAVADYYSVPLELFSRRHESHIARDVAAWLCRRHTEATLQELAAPFGLSGAMSVPNLTKRLEAKLARSPKLRRELNEIEKRLTSPSSARLRVGSNRRKTK